MLLASSITTAAWSGSPSPQTPRPASACSANFCFSYWAPRSEQEELDPQPNELDPPLEGGYIGGYLTESSSLLDGISFYTRGQLQSSLEIRYDDVDVDEFNPEPNIHTRPRPKGYVGKYMVDGITRCDRQKVCLPWSRFEWNWSPSEWSAKGEDFAYADQETHPVNGPKRCLARTVGTSMATATPTS